MVAGVIPAWGCMSPLMDQYPLKYTLHSIAYITVQKNPEEYIRVQCRALHCSRVGEPEYVVCREDNPYKVASTWQTIVCSLVQIGLVFKTVCTSKEDMKRSRARVTLGGQYLLLQIRNKVPRILRKITKYPCESHLARCIAEPLKFF